MTRKMYSIRDIKGDYFNAVHISSTHGEAERNFRTLVNEPNSTVSKYPEDFDLYCVGEFNDTDGTITPKYPAERICNGSQFVQKPN